MARHLFVDVIVDPRTAERGFDRSTRAARKFSSDMDKTFRGVLAGSGAFQSLGRSLAFASTAFIGTASATAALKASVDAASNLAEQTNKINVVFDESGRTLTQWAKTTATTIGIANDQALEAAGTFGNLFNTVGMAPAKNAELSRSLVKLAADMASFNNADPSEVLIALRSGLIGEAEPLRRYGVLLSEARVQQEAMRETGKRSVKQLTDQDKVLARYALIMRDTTSAQGDFSRTQNGLANASRQLKAEIRDTEASIGRALLPTVRQLTLRLRDWLGDSRNQRDIQRQVTDALRVGTDVVRGLVEVFRGLRAVLRPIVDLLGGVKNAAMVAGAAFLLLRARALLAAAGIIRTGEAAMTAGGRVGLLGMQLRSLPAKVAVSVLVAAELIGPGKRILEEAFGVEMGGVTPGGGTERPGQFQSRAIRAARRLKRAGNTNAAIRAILASGVYGPFSQPEIDAAINAITTTGEDVALRGAGARTPAPAAAAGRGRTRASFRYQMSLLEERLAQAELTTSRRDDRAILVRQAALLKRWIATTKDLGFRTQLYQQLGSVDSQIRQIDEQAATEAERQRKARLDAHRKELAARKKALEEEKRANEQRLSTLRAHEQTLRSRIREITAQFAQAVQTAREGIGQLFGGPVMNPVERDVRGILGVTGIATGPTPGRLAADIRAQNRQFVQRQRLITRILRRAPRDVRGLIASDIQDLDLPTLQAVSRMTRGQFGALVGRERLAQRTARVMMRAQLVQLHAARVRLHDLRVQERIVIRNIVTLDGKIVHESTNTHRQRSAKTSVAQRRGNTAGVNRAVGV